MAFFLRPLTQHEPDSLFYRSMSSASKIDRNKASRKYIWLKQVTSYLRGFVRFPQIKVPQLDVLTDLGAIDSNIITLSASRTRKFWGLGNGPISDVTLLLENNGIIVSKVSLETMYMDGLSGWDANSNTPYVMLGNDKGSAVRSRFDAAHELGHLVLHRSLSPELIRNPINNRLIESQANEFAGAFLLPEESYSDDLHVVNLDSLRTLKSKWLVSIGAMMHRANSLGLTTEKEARDLWRNYTRRGWKTREPMDDELALEYPRLLRRAFELIINRGVQDTEQIISDLCLFPSDISELSCVEEGLLLTRAHAENLEVNEYNSRDLRATEEYVISRDAPQNLN